MDALELHGGLGGAMAMSVGYASNPLRIRPTDGSGPLALVSGQASAAFGVAASYDRWRLYLDMNMPLAITGQSGTIGEYQFVAPAVDLGSHPDTLSDARIGLDARLWGEVGGPFRLGAGVQLFVPNGNRADYVTDGYYRGMGRVLFAGDLGGVSYAGLCGVHIRPLDDSPTPGSPQGSELLFGVAAGPRLELGSGAALVVGPEVYGETAFRRFLAGPTTGLEALLTGRVEGELDNGMQLRAKLGAGGGLHPDYGAPEWRTVVSVEVAGRAR